jgi:hypothetical protein
MRRGSLTFWLIAAFAVVIAVIAYRAYLSDVVAPLTQVAKVRSAPSKIYTHLLIAYDKPPVFQEEYDMQDVNGASTYDYRIRTYSGKQITITSPPHATYDVSFFFGKLVQDGVWQLVNKPPRGNTAIHYTVYVKQEVDFKQGDRTILFTDPHYWATTAGRQYEIDLRKTNPNDLLKLNSNTLNDPRYLQIVRDFRSFGPPEFRARIESVRRQLNVGPLPQ